MEAVLRAFGASFVSNKGLGREVGVGRHFYTQIRHHEDKFVDFAAAMEQSCCNMYGRVFYYTKSKRTCDYSKHKDEYW